MATALPMAAGAAGGMLLGSALSNAFAGGHSQPRQRRGGRPRRHPELTENNFFGGSGNEDLGSALGGGNDLQDASFDDDSGGDFGGDLGGGGDDDWV